VPTDSSLPARLARQLPELVAAVTADRAAAASDPVAQETLRVIVSCLYDERDVDDDDLTRLRAAAVRHAEEGTALSVLLGGGYVAAGALWATVADSDEPTARSTGTALIRILEQVTAALAEAYFEEKNAIRAEEHDARRALATALISGEQVDWPEAQLGVRIAPAYIALALQLVPHESATSEDAGSADGAVAARQRLRRLQEHLDVFGGEPVLSLLDPTGGVALLPTTAEELNERMSELPQLVGAIGSATGTDVVGGAAACVGVIAVARTARQARDVLAIARRLERPPGLYVLDDVLLEYQLTRDSDARPLLAELLDPLESSPDLLRTLECYVEHELDRRSTATALHVHPNTLDYRLRRIGQLTGLDPAKPSGQQLLTAALTARRLV
jgi:hypothetical protein